MLYEIVHQFPKDMIFKEDGPLVSLYQPTHRSYPDNKQDPIVFKNLLREIENSLERLPNGDKTDSILKPLHEIKDNPDFWMHTLDGIAVFASANGCIVYHLQAPVKEFAVVSNRFHITPVIQAFQSTEDYQLLGVSRENFSLFQGNRYGFEEINIQQDTPRTMKEVLGDQLSDSYLSHGSYGGAGGPTMYHGHGDVKQEIDKDTEKYFRYVDAFVFENYSKKSKRPLILVALKEYHSEFKSLSNNPYLMEEGIDKPIEALDPDEMLERVQPIIEAINREKVQKAVELYARAEAESLGSSDLTQVAKAAFESRVETILIEEDKIVPGIIDHETGKVRLGDINNPDNGNILDELAEWVLSTGGTVFVLAKDKMPSTTGVAAIYRYS